MSGNDSRASQKAINFTEEDVEEWFEEETEPESDEEPETVSLTDIEARYIKSQLRVVRTTIDFTLHNLQFVLKDPNYINFSPVYQRRDRWDTKKRSLLIESLLMNIPIPPIFLYENQYNQYEVMDGRQRLETIRDFLNDGLRLRGLEYWTELQGMKFSKLPQVIKSGILRRTLPAIVLLAETGEQKDAKIDVRMALFQRLNTGGVRLNPQELRNALYVGPFNDMLIKAARSNVFTRIWGIPPYEEGEDEKPSPHLQKNTLYRTMADCELVLRFFSLKEMMLLDLKGALRSLLDNCMIRHLKDDQKTVEPLAREFLTCLTTLDNLFEQHPFILPKTERPSHTLYDSLMVALAIKGTSSLADAPDMVQARLAEAMKDPLMYDVLVNRFNTVESIKSRVQLASSILFGEGLQ